MLEFASKTMGGHFLFLISATMAAAICPFSPFLLQGHLAIYGRRLWAWYQQCFQKLFSFIKKISQDFTDQFTDQQYNDKEVIEDVHNIVYN